MGAIVINFVWEKNRMQLNLRDTYPRCSILIFFSQIE